VSGLRLRLRACGCRTGLRLNAGHLAELRSAVEGLIERARERPDDDGVWTTVLWTAVDREDRSHREDRSQIHAPGWPGMLVATSVRVLPPGPVAPPATRPGTTGMATRSAGAKWGRIHSGMAIWSAMKTARVAAMAGMVRRISAPAPTPRAKAKAA
jgi:hypothetical protein